MTSFEKATSPTYPAFAFSLALEVLLSLSFQIQTIFRTCETAARDLAKCGVNTLQTQTISQLCQHLDTLRAKTSDSESGQKENLSLQKHGATERKTTLYCNGINEGLATTRL